MQASAGGSFCKTHWLLCSHLQLPSTRGGRSRPQSSRNTPKGRHDRDKLCTKHGSSCLGRLKSLFPGEKPRRSALARKGAASRAIASISYVHFCFSFPTDSHAKNTSHKTRDMTRDTGTNTKHKRRNRLQTTPAQAILVVGGPCWHDSPLSEFIAPYSLSKSTLTACCLDHGTTT